MVDPGSTADAVDLTATANAIRACWEDVCQALASDDDKRAARELAGLGYTERELEPYLRRSGFARLREALVELSRDRLEPEVDAEAEVDRRLREMARRQRSEVITALSRELGRRLFPAKVMWALHDPELSDERFREYVDALRAGKRLVVDDYRRLIDPTAPPPPRAPRREEHDNEAPPARPAGPTRETDPDDHDQEVALDHGRELDPDEEL